MRLKAADEGIYQQQVLGLIGSFEELGHGAPQRRGPQAARLLLRGLRLPGPRGHARDDARNASDAVTQGRLWEVDSNARYGDARLRTIFAEMTRVMSSADTVVHAVDVTGLGTDDSLTRTEMSNDIWLAASHGRESLNYVSAETGGRFFRDTNDLGVVLGEIQDMTSRFYILGYRPTARKTPGQFHKLKVKVARKGANLSHRAGLLRARGRGPADGAAAQVRGGPARDDGRGAERPQVLGPLSALPRGRAPPDPGGGHPGAQGGSWPGRPGSHLARGLRLRRGRGRLGRRSASPSSPTSIPRGPTPPATHAGCRSTAPSRCLPGRYTIKLMVQAGRSGRLGRRSSSTSRFLPTIRGWASCCRRW